MTKNQRKKKLVLSAREAELREELEDAIVVEGAFVLEGDDDRDLRAVAFVRGHDGRLWRLPLGFLRHLIDGEDHLEDSGLGLEILET